MIPYSKQHLLAAVTERFQCRREFFKFSDVIDHSVEPANAVVLRFDVERDLKHHLRVAQQLSSMGIPASFYFHTRRGCFDTEVLRTIEGLGHEVGYHHECLDRCHGDFDHARELFLRECDLFRNAGIQLRTVCSHGEAGLPKRGYRSNWDIFDRQPDLLSTAGLTGEVYLWLRDARPFYASDTFRNYKVFWAKLAEAQSDGAKPLMVLAHLHRWRSNPIRTAFEVYKDLLRLMGNRIRKKRGYRLGY